MRTHILDDGRAVRVLFSEKQISERIEELAGVIKAASLKDIVVVAILKGSFIFAADLLRGLHRQGLAPEVDFMTLQSYHDGTQSSGKVKIVRDIERPVDGREVLIVDDILESGRTLAFAKAYLGERGAATTSTCVLLDKRVERAAAIEADYIAFTCPDEFVIGYGMDIANKYRELPFVGRMVCA